MVRCFIVEFSYWTIVDQPLHPSNRIRRDFGDVGSFRDETSDDSDPVLRRPLILTGVRAGEIGLCATPHLSYQQCLDLSLFKLLVDKDL